MAQKDEWNRSFSHWTGNWNDVSAIIFPFVEKSIRSIVICNNKIRFAHCFIIELLKLHRLFRSDANSPIRSDDSNAIARHPFVVLPLFGARICKWSIFEIAEQWSEFRIKSSTTTIGKYGNLLLIVGNECIVNSVCLDSDKFETDMIQLSVAAQSSAGPPE